MVQRFKHEVQILHRTNWVSRFKWKRPEKAVTAITFLGISWILTDVSRGTGKFGPYLEGITNDIFHWSLPSTWKNKDGRKNLPILTGKLINIIFENKNERRSLTGLNMWRTYIFRYYRGCHIHLFPIRFILTRQNRCCHFHFLFRRVLVWGPE